MKKNKQTKPRKRLFKKKIAVFNKHVKHKRVTDDGSKTEFELLDEEYAKQILAKEQELAVLKAKREQLRQFAQDAKKIHQPESEPDRYRGKGMTEAALDAVRRLTTGKEADNGGVTAAQVRQYLLAHGFTAPGNFDVASAVTLNRLHFSGKLQRRSTVRGIVFKFRNRLGLLT